MKGLLFLNGQPPKSEVLKSLDYKNCITVCADGAYNYLKDYCRANILVGDFDSLTSNKNLNAQKIIKLDREKDFTDGHIALEELLNLKPDSIEIYGACKGRPDHELSNYSLLALANKRNIDTVIKGDKFDIYLAGDIDSHTSTSSLLLNVEIGKTVSIVPFTDILHILSTKGLKYAIQNEIFNKLHIKGISNIATHDSIELKIANGCALVFVEREG